MSFESLVKKLMKEGKSKAAATKIAGSVANAKMKGAGSVPTAKQKARAKSPGTKKKPKRIVTKEKTTGFDAFGGGGAATGTRKTITKGDKKVVKNKKKFETGTKSKSTVKTNDPGAEIIKSGDDERIMPPDVKQGKYVIKRKKTGTSASTGKKAKVKKTIKSTYVDGKEVKRKEKIKTPAKMKKSPAKEELKGKQKNLPPELKAKIEASPAKKRDKMNIKPKMEKVISSKSKSKSNKNKKVTVDKKKKEDVRTGDISKTKVKTKLNKNTGDYVTKKKTVTKGDSGRNKTKSKVKGNQQEDAFENMIDAQFNRKTNPSPRFKTEVESAFSPAKKSKQRVEQDYARNAIADYKSGNKKAGNYEKRKALETAAGESPSTKKSMAYMKSNQDGGSYTAKKPGAAAKQLKKLGSILSKHMKSN
jgi:hypothetical protein